MQYNGFDEVRDLTYIHTWTWTQTHDERWIPHLQARIQIKQIYFIPPYLHHPPPTSLVNTQRCTRAQGTTRGVKVTGGKVTVTARVLRPPVSTHSAPNLLQRLSLGATYTLKP